MPCTKRGAWSLRPCNSTTVSTNVRAIALWKSLGFAVVGTVPQAVRHAAHGLAEGDPLRGVGLLRLDVVPLGALRQRSDDVLGRTDLRIAASEIDQRLAALRRRECDSRE